METEGTMGMLRQGLSSSKSPRVMRNKAVLSSSEPADSVANGNTVGILLISLVGKQG